MEVRGSKRNEQLVPMVHDQQHTGGQWGERMWVSGKGPETLREEATIPATQRQAYPHTMLGPSETFGERT